MRLFATCRAGTGRSARRALDRIAAVSVTGLGFDGRSDVIRFQAPAPPPLQEVEDLFVEIGSADREWGDDPDALAYRMRRSVPQALHRWADLARPPGEVRFRISSAVVHDEAAFRSGLEQALGRTLAQLRPQWRQADTAEHEVRISEYGYGRYAAGLHLRAPSAAPLSPAAAPAAPGGTPAETTPTPLEHE